MGEGTYTVTVTNSDGCTNESEEFDAQFVGINEGLSFEANCDLEGKCTIFHAGVVAGNQLQIIDPTGKLLAAGADYSFEQRSGSIHIQLSKALPAGIYMGQYVLDGNRVSFRMVKL